MIYDICYWLLRWMFRVFFRLKVIGTENVPRTGPVILASNHVSYLDPLFLGVSLPRRLNYLAKEELFRTPLSAWFLNKLQAFPVSREKVSASSVRKSFQLVNQGKALLLFPEGTRGDGKDLLKGKRGIGIIAEKSKAAIVPAYLHGPEKILPRGSNRLHFHEVSVCFGPPLFLSLASVKWGEEKERGYEEVAERVMSEIANLKRRSF
jgi:1-acyl-sn-glycerol-3-phosphate acyltransferase